jgi:hypothetical protein
MSLLDGEPVEVLVFSTTAGRPFSLSLTGQRPGPWRPTTSSLPGWANWTQCPSRPAAGEVTSAGVGSTHRGEDGWHGTVPVSTSQPNGGYPTRAATCGNGVPTGSRRTTTPKAPAGPAGPGSGAQRVLPGRRLVPVPRLVLPPLPRGCTQCSRPDSSTGTQGFRCSTDQRVRPTRSQPHRIDT